MSNGNDLTGLMKFLPRDNWADRFDQVLQEHFAPACEMLNMEFAAITGLIGEHAATNLWGAAFEDFLTREFGPDNENIVDTYLARRGWNERTQAKQYMKAMRGAVMSIYEVSEIVPGKSFHARDLIRGESPITVSEVSASQQLKQWDRLAARIVIVGNKNIMSGGTLLFAREASDGVIDTFKALTASKGNKRAREASFARHAAALGLAPLITTAWLADAVPHAAGERMPTLLNSEGDEVLFHTTRFPLRAGVSHADIVARLNNVAALRPEDGNFWNWLGGPAPAKPAASTGQDARALITTMEDGSLVLGNVDLKGEFVTLSVNSAKRSALGRALLEQAIGPLVREPLTEIQTIAQMQATRSSRPPADPIPPEIAGPIIHDMLNEQYRRILDEPVGALGDISPRAAIRTAKGRQKVAEWLKILENKTANVADPSDPMATYDFGWMWRELKVEKLRQ